MSIFEFGCLPTMLVAVSSASDVEIKIQVHARSHWLYVHRTGHYWHRSNIFRSLNDDRRWPQLFANNEGLLLLGLRERGR